MELKEIKYIDKIEVVINSVVQVREATVITKDNVEVSKSFHRWCIAPGEDYSTQEQQVQDICKVTHTPEVIEKYKAQQEKNKLG